MDAAGYRSSALLSPKGGEETVEKKCAVLVPRSSLQLLASGEKVSLGQARDVIAFENELVCSRVGPVVRGGLAKGQVPFFCIHTGTRLDS